MIRALTLALVASLALLACAQPAPEADPAAAVSAPRGPAETIDTRDAAASGDTKVLSSDARTAAASSEIPLFAVGDIADCDVRTDEKVARFLQARTARIVLLGDLAYNRGSASEFANCFDPQWGKMFDRLYPVPGNHEYGTPGAKGYFDYFDRKRAVRPGKGWYGFNLGEHWKVLALNSQCDAVGGCDADSPQGRWLAGALERAGRRNVIAYFHVPLYSSGEHGSNSVMRPLFRQLYQGGVDIVLNGHDHDYERFAPQNAVGDRREHGIQQFVVGTGGKTLYEWGGPRLPNTRTRNNTTYGALRLALRPHGYSWEFKPVVGTYTDSGSRSLN